MVYDTVSPTEGVTLSTAFVTETSIMFSETGLLKLLISQGSKLNLYKRFDVDPPPCIPALNLNFGSLV